MVEINPSDNAKPPPGKKPTPPKPKKDFKAVSSDANQPHNPSGASSGAGKSLGSGDKHPNYYKNGKGWDSYKTWMGKKGYQEFMKNLEQGVVQQIGKQKAKEKAASDRLKRAEEGKDMYS